MNSSFDSSSLKSLGYNLGTDIERRKIGQVAFDYFGVSSFLCVRVCVCVTYDMGCNAGTVSQHRSWAI